MGTWTRDDDRWIPVVQEVWGDVGEWTLSEPCGLRASCLYEVWSCKESCRKGQEWRRWIQQHPYFPWDGPAGFPDRDPHTHYYPAHMSYWRRRLTELVDLGPIWISGTHAIPLYDSIRYLAQVERMWERIQWAIPATDQTPWGARRSGTVWTVVDLPEMLVPQGSWIQTGPACRLYLAEHGKWVERDQWVWNEKPWAVRRLEDYLALRPAKWEVGGTGTPMARELFREKYPDLCPPEEASAQ